MSLLTNFQTKKDKIDTAKKLSNWIVEHKLPHTQIEYISVSSGAPYINTGYRHTSTTKVEIKFYASSSNTTGYIGLMGARKGSFQNNSYNFFTRFNSNSNFCYSRTGAENTGTGWYNQEVVLTTYGLTATYTNGINTRTITSIGKSDDGVNDFLLFNLNTAEANNVRNDSTNTAGIRIYYCKIWNDDGITLARDIIPVKDKNGEICMYDKITKTYYYKQGSGVFAAGPEI